MKNAASWKPSKFTVVGGRLVPSNSVNIASRRMAEYIADFYNYTIPKYLKGDVLDMGCGNVPMYLFYKDFINTVTCIDWENSVHEQIHIDAFCDLNKELPYNNETFDSIICSDVIEHLNDASKAISEIYRLLKKGAIALINFPFMYGLHEEPHDFARYTEYHIKHLAGKYGFEIIECRVYGTLVDMFEHSSIRLIKLLPLGGIIAGVFEKLIMPLIRLMYHKRVKALNKHPYMYGFVLQK